MPDYHYEIEQGTREWLELRLGLLTASEVKNLLTPKLKVVTGKAFNTAVNNCAAERIRKEIEFVPQTFHMKRGHLEEDIAKAYYSEQINPLTDCGFITNDEVFGHRVGFSPDGLVGEDGIIEVKSRLGKYQVETILSGEVPAEYMAQCQMGLAVSGREWCDFIQYSNGMPMFVKRVFPDPHYLDAIKEVVLDFETNVVRIVNDFEAKSAELIQTEFVELDFNQKKEEDDEDVAW